MKAPVERFWAFVDKSGDCWLWTGQLLKRGEGHGRFHETSKIKHLAHRYAYELANGPVPAGMCVLHRCDNPPCVRVEHLFLGTQIDNIADRQQKRRQAIGERIGGAKITAAVVHELRRRWAAGETQTSLAREVGLNSATVSRIVNRESWSHVA